MWKNLALQHSIAIVIELAAQKLFAKGFAFSCHPIGRIHLLDEDYWRIATKPLSEVSITSRALTKRCPD